MERQFKKVAIVGVGNVGASYAYAMLNHGTANEIVLLSHSKNHAIAQANDMLHGNTFLKKSVNIYGGEYSDCKDADLVCITAGLPQKEGQTRLDLAQDNANLMKSIVTEIMASGFNGVLLIAANPVDIMTHVAQKVSGLPHNKVVGSGTSLDSARFRQNLANYFNISPKSIHARIIGEHGDSSVPLWSSAMIGPKSVLDYVNENSDKYNFEDLKKAYEEARDAAYEIIKEKGSTYYGIGIALNAITHAILNDQNITLSVTSYLNGQFGIDDVYIAVPSIVGKNGVREVLNLNLLEEEREKLVESAKTLKNIFNGLEI